MAKDTSGYVNLNYVVNLVLMDMEEYTTAQKKKVLQYAILGFTELNLYVLPSIRVEYLKQNDDFSVDLPDDYIDYTKIGILVDGAEKGSSVVTLTLNENLPYPNTSKLKVCPNSCVDEPTISLNSTDYFIPGFGYYFAEHYRNGQYVGEMYGLGGGLGLMTYRVDEQNRQIIFSDFYPEGDIVLEYKSTGIKTDGSSVVPRQAVQALRYYIHWQMIEFNDRVPANQKEQRKRQYYTEYNKLQWFENSFTIDEYLDAKYQVSVPTIKR